MQSPKQIDLRGELVQPAHGRLCSACRRIKLARFNARLGARALELSYNGIASKPSKANHGSPPIRAYGLQHDHYTGVPCV